MRGNLPDLSIRQLEYLVAVADSPTWAAAAADVGVSPSALSQGLAELERRVGVKLFEASGRRRLLRSAAIPVLDHARQVVALTTDLARWSDRLRTAQSGSVRLGLIDVAAVAHLRDSLRRFRTDRHDVTLTLTVAPSRRLLDQLIDGDLDAVACVEPPEPRPGIVTEPLLTEGLHVFAPPGQRLGPPEEWGPWVLFPDGSHTRRLVEDHLRSLGASVVVAAESHQPDVLREMVLLGMGWTVLPESQGRVSDGDAAPGGAHLLDRQLVLARRSGAVSDPAVDELLERFRRST
ncbi:LysR family transcriptional regulator [Ilumatobacter coccineus]|uniref:Putative LysR family transcriptional regulator n=1 Tax=Ilumatobacter coccineus (strain NBRC 103263 / KCTC 29153 / YM16-304) TaxID=1313172 RepID=A0A6C7EB16_ILUCY|nr:LysR family transcriptional regulator [Ilumatobacter coccineus]BAN03671.1 putative LysR family transcriptional regulator [Ilumatobacter coccineus YM16-304]